LLLRIPAYLAAALWLVACAPSGRGPAVLTVDVPLHLEDHLDSAVVTGSAIPENLPGPVEWRFDREQPDWIPMDPIPGRGILTRSTTEGALRLKLKESGALAGDRLICAIYVELGDWKVGDWGHVEIQARTSDRMRDIGLAFNHTTEEFGDSFPFYSFGDRAPLVTDGTVQTYRLSLGEIRKRWEGPWTHLAVWFTGADKEMDVTLDILSVRVVPLEAAFASELLGTQLVWRRDPGIASQDSPYRRTLYMHAPGSIAYPVQIPDESRLDVGLGVLRGDVPVRFSIRVEPENGGIETLLDESYSDPDTWGQRSVDLSHLAGRTVNLSLELEAEKAGTVGLWSVPILSGLRATARPNVIF
jgi:hypothetical protein